MHGWTELREAVAETAPALGPGTVVAAASTRSARTSSPRSTTGQRVYCPGPRRTEFDFLGRRDPPPGVPVLYIHDDHYREDPASAPPGP